MLKILLPWPPKGLSPNSRLHWAAKSRIAAKYKRDCLLMVPRTSKFPDGVIDMKITFCPPDKRRRDVDNMLSAIKAGLDAVAIKWCVDDARFRLVLDIGEVVKFGAVEVVV